MEEEIKAPVTESTAQQAEEVRETAEAAAEASPETVPAAEETAASAAEEAAAPAAEETAPKAEEPAESMADFEAEIDASLRRYERDEKVKCTVISVDVDTIMATHSSILAWRISWTEEPGRLQSMGLQRVGHN